MNRDENGYSLGNLYLIRLYNDCEDFLKIGTTVHKYCRFYEIMKSGYKVEVVYMIIGIDFLKALEYERVLHDVFYITRYKPNIKFGGYTECYSEIDFDKYKHIVSLLKYKAIIKNYTVIRKNG